MFSSATTGIPAGDFFGEETATGCWGIRMGVAAGCGRDGGEATGGSGWRKGPGDSLTGVDSEEDGSDVDAVVAECALGCDGSGCSIGFTGDGEG